MESGDQYSDSAVERHGAPGPAKLCPLDQKCFGLTSSLSKVQFRVNYVCISRPDEQGKLLVGGVAWFWELVQENS